jgi:hypothetical protein
VTLLKRIDSYLSEALGGLDRETEDEEEYVNVTRLLPHVNSGGKECPIIYIPEDDDFDYGWGGWSTIEERFDATVGSSQYVYKKCVTHAKTKFVNEARKMFDEAFGRKFSGALLRFEILAVYGLPPLDRWTKKDMESWEAFKEKTLKVQSDILKPATLFNLIDTMYYNTLEFNNEEEQD